MASDETNEVIEQVTQALQVALLLATRARQDADVRAGESRQLETAVRDASKAVKRLSPDGVMDEDKGGAS